MKTNPFGVGAMAALMLLSVVSATADDHRHSIFVLTSTNDPSGNQVEVFQLNVAGTSSLSFVKSLPTGGNGGAGGKRGRRAIQRFFWRGGKLRIQ